MVLPFCVDFVVCIFDLVTNDRGCLPRRVESKRLLSVRGPHQEVIEQVPLAAFRCFWFCMCNCTSLASRGFPQTVSRTIDH